MTVREDGDEKLGDDHTHGEGRISGTDILGTDFDVSHGSMKLSKERMGQGLERGTDSSHMVTLSGHTRVSPTDGDEW